MENSDSVSSKLWAKIANLSSDGCKAMWALSQYMTTLLFNRTLPLRTSFIDQLSEDDMMFQLDEAGKIVLPESAYGLVEITDLEAAVAVEGGAGLDLPVSDYARLFETFEFLNRLRNDIHTSIFHATRL
jgi:hypothetical protein